MPSAGRGKHISFHEIGSTPQSLCSRCAKGFFGRPHSNDAGILAHFKGFLCGMTGNLQQKLRKATGVLRRSCRYMMPRRSRLTPSMYGDRAEPGPPMLLLLLYHKLTLL